MADIQYYERILKKKDPRVKIFMIALYLFILSVWLVVTVRFGLNAAIILMIPLSVLIAVLLTWKYTVVEYEYSFTAGIFTFSKIYGRSSRKKVFEAELKSAVTVRPYDPAREIPDDFSTLINAVPAPTAQNPCYCIFETDDKRICVILDCDEMTARIFKFFNASATDRDIFKMIAQENKENNNHD